MAIELTLTPELRARVESIAARSTLSAAEVVADALENGHSLEWQERFIAKVANAIEAADRGDFASAAEVESVKNKYRPT